MNYYSQKQSGYEKIRLGTCKNTMRSHGCFVCSLGMLSYVDPLKVNKLFTDKNGYSQGCLVKSEKATQLLGLKYEGRTQVKPNFICIAETKLVFSRYKSQHFFVFAPTGTIHASQDLMLDTLDTPSKIGWRPVTYKIISYRLFHEKQPKDTESEEFKRGWQEMKKIGVYSEFTKKHDKVNTSTLAVFLDRFKNKL